MHAMKNNINSEDKGERSKDPQKAERRREFNVRV
jgi:hypothetical protein